MNANLGQFGTSLTATILLLAAIVVGADEKHTEKNPKYQQRSRSHSIERLGSLETSVIDAFKKLYPAKAGAAVKAVLVVDDGELAAAADAVALRNAVRSSDIADDLGKLLRKAGLEVVQVIPDGDAYLHVDVRLGTRPVEVHEFTGVQTRWLPDVRATASTSWDRRVVGQAQSLEFLGNDAQSYRAFERIGTQNLVRAMGIMLLHDFTTSNAIEVALNARDALKQGNIELSESEYRGPASKPEIPSAQANRTTPAKPAPRLGQTPSQATVAPPKTEGATLLAQSDREQALRQIIAALNPGKS